MKPGAGTTAGTARSIAAKISISWSLPDSLSIGGATSETATAAGSDLNRASAIGEERENRPRGNSKVLVCGTPSALPHGCTAARSKRAQRVYCARVPPQRMRTVTLYRSSTCSLTISTRNV
jgi:hypothetical protein